MTQDFLMGQLRLIAIALIAFASGRGWLSASDAGTITAVLTPVGLIAAPWIWSVWRNLNGKVVPGDSVAVHASDVLKTTSTIDGKPIAIPENSAMKIVGALLLGFILLQPFDARAEIFQKPAAVIAKPNILKALDAAVLPDLQYALKLAKASGSKVTAPCYEVWIGLIQARQKAVSNDDGSEMPLPNPRVITDFEKAVAIRNALQPDSDFMIKCAPVAGMVKKDILSFIGVILGGGVGLGTLVPGL